MQLLIRCGLCRIEYQIYLMLTSALLIHANEVSAQIVPNAGVIQREVEAARPEKTKPEHAQVLPQPAANDDPNAPHFLVNQIDIEGAELFDNKQLAQVVEKAIGQSLSIQQLQSYGQLLSDYYRSQGWLARVVLPKQDFSSGKIRIVIIEARYSGTELNSESGRADAEFVREQIIGNQQSGSALQLQTLESDLLKANDLPGILTTAVLAPGEHAGDTKIKLKLNDTSLVSGYLNYSNQGLRSIGSNQYQGNVVVNNPMGRGDQFSVQAIGSENMVSVRSQYSFLLADLGTRMSIYGSHLQYQLGGSFANLHAEGEGRLLGGVLSQSLIRQAEQNLSASLTLENRLNQNNQLKIQNRLHDVNAMIFTLKGDKTDYWFGKAINNAALNLGLGYLNIEMAEEKNSDARTARAQGEFLKYNFNLNRTEYLNQDWQLSLAFNGQWAAKNLDASQKFALGGPNGIRAYPVNEAMGDSGWLLNIELQRELGYGLQGLLFADTGGIKVNQRLWSGVGNSPNTYLLSGVGIGLRWSDQQHWQASALLGLPVTSNPARDRFNHNSDGTRAGDPAGWLTLTKFFQL